MRATLGRSLWPPTLSRHFPLEPGQARRIELVLATARVFLAVTSLVAVFLDPTEPSRYAGLAYTLFVVYVAFSIAILTVLRLRPGLPPRIPVGVHAADVVWAAAITLFTQGPSSPFFVFFVFVLLAAAYRWGARATLGTAAVAVLLIFMQVILIAIGGLGAVLAGEEIEVNRIIMRGTYLLLMGALLGFLAEQQKQLRSETAAVARLMKLAQSSPGLRASLQAVLEELLRLFEARQALLAIQEKTTGRLFLWDVARGAGGHPTAVRLSEIGSEERDTYLFPVPGKAFAAHRASQESFRVRALDAGGALLPAAALSLPGSFLDEHADIVSLFGLDSDFGEEWTGRLLLLDPQSAPAPETELRFLQALIRQVNPALNNLYLLRRLRTRASAMERARVARELHDGTIQSLIAIEMQVEVLRRQAGENVEAETELGRLQQHLRDEVINLRELMQQLNPPVSDPRHFLEFLADTVERFRRQTGIGAQFVCDLDEASLPPRVCRELGRILQEALVNIRKHSRARHILVQFGSENGRWRLVIDDDGRGFDFQGRFSQAELDAARKGPLVIKERVRSIGGELAIESRPEGGARLEITLPFRNHA